MEIKTAWNYCLFVAENSEDRDLLQKIYHNIKDKSNISTKQKAPQRFSAKEIYELHIETYC